MRRTTKSRARLFKSDRVREWATDFMIGIGMFVLVAFFASTHTDSALPAPLAKTEAVFQQHREQVATPLSQKQTLRSLQYVSSHDITSHRPAKTEPARNDNMMMIFMALLFSALLTLTIQFWRNLRRAYASPRRKWGKG